MVKKVTPQPASLLLPLPPPAHVRGKRPVNPYIGVLAQKDAWMTTKISILKRRSGGSMAYVVTFGRPMATRRRWPKKRRREGNECSYCLGSPSGLNKCAASRVPAGAQIVTYSCLLKWASRNWCVCVREILRDRVRVCDSTLWTCTQPFASGYKYNGIYFS